MNLKLEDTARENKIHEAFFSLEQDRQFKLRKADWT